MIHPILKMLLFSLILFPAGASFAKSEQDVHFKDITITTSSSHLLLFGVVSNTKHKELEQALHSGIPMRFTFFVELSHTRNNWMDEELVELEFTHTLKYDTLKEHYQLELEEQKNRTFTYANLDEAMAVMNEINGLKVIELTELQADNAYEIRLKAELFQKTLPMNLHYIVPFISMLNLETDWITIEFTY